MSQHLPNGFDVFTGLVGSKWEWVLFGFFKYWKEIEPLWRVTASLQGFFHKGHSTYLHLSFIDKFKRDIKLSKTTFNFKEFRV